MNKHHGNGKWLFHLRKAKKSIESALEKAKNVANKQDIRIGGGTSTIRQYLQAGLIDEMHLAFSPVFLGSGEPLISGIDLPKLGFTEIETIYGEKSTHIMIKKSH